MSSLPLVTRLLVANRGEIAIRVLTSARDLGIYTIAVYTSEDANHAAYADEGVLLNEPSAFTNVSKLVSIAKETRADSVHPGYGFLSENPEFADALSNIGVHFVGPSSRVLRQTANKTDARALAEASSVPTLPASTNSMRNYQEAQEFINQFGLPIMFKAIDGGGGRGIRLVREPHELEDSFNRATGESPSGQVFVERAAVDGFRHVEVQILADLHGNVGHLWERECSIQRRFQKMVELAPSTISNRALIGSVIESAVRMAKSIKYSSLGTFEFLVHDSRPEFYFLEVNPRLQVEHTITEEISGIDIVRSQLLLARGATIESLNLPSRDNISAPLGISAIQARITAEDTEKEFTLSMGRVTQFQHPLGAGVRVDTHLSSTKPTTVGPSYDPLLAKIIVRGPSLESARLKGLRALCDTTIKGVRTNIEVLMGILSHPDFQTEQCNTRWLETNLQDVISYGAKLGSQSTLSLREPYITSTTAETSSNGGAGLGSAAVLFRKGEALKMQMTDITSKQKAMPSAATVAEEYILRFDRILNNNFPLQLTADVTFQSASSRKAYALNLTSTTQNSAASSRHRRADLNDISHIALPFPGQFVEMYVDEGDVVAKGELICVIRQMKMELEVRAPSGGTIKWALEAEKGEQLNEGLLLCEVVLEENVVNVTPLAKL